MTMSTSTLVIDLALLGVLADGSADPDDVCRHVQTVCRPWLSPTTTVLCDRLQRWLARGALARDAAGDVHLTATGEAQLDVLLRTPVDGVAHGLLPLVETLKMALADRLDQAGRAALVDELTALRRHCLESQSRAALASAPTLVHRCADRRRRAAAAAHEALARDLGLARAAP